MFNFCRRRAMAPATLAKLQELAARIGKPAPASYRRLYPGHWQRAQGAWSWVAEAADGLTLFGSSDPLHTCLKHGVELCDDGETLYAKGDPQ